MTVYCIESMIVRRFLISMLTLSFGSVALAQDDADTEALAKAAQNPIADLIRLPLQNNTNFNVGPQERTQNILNVQPVWPFSISEVWNVVTRTNLPVVYITSHCYPTNGTAVKPKVPQRKNPKGGAPVFQADQSSRLTRANYIFMT